MVALAGAARAAVALQRAGGLLELGRRDPQPPGVLVEAPGGDRVGVGIRAKWQVVSEIGPGAVEAGTFRSDGDAVGQEHGISRLPRLDRGGGGFQPALDLEDRPDKGSGIAAVEDERVEAVESQ